jgi:hypothetical protein
LASILAFILAFFLAFYLTFYSGIYVEIFSDMLGGGERRKEEEVTPIKPRDPHLAVGE